ncbi:hypothetical protein BJ878DRAFT_32613 [Calycina marina]|uniref:CCHC-type domain-containing protein n=1 Tax=Calycina marina TaxID=1763456 RepID=A0A9P7Z5B2_9HELO|nr:hypothetical protein BJ878DRAFT_32613 [Calycina marina]
MSRIIADFHSPSASDNHWLNHELAQAHVPKKRHRSHTNLMHLSCSLTLSVRNTCLFHLPKIYFSSHQPATCDLSAMPATTVEEWLAKEDADAPRHRCKKIIREWTTKDGAFVMCGNADDGTKQTHKLVVITPEMSSLSRRACYKCGNVGHYAEVCSSAERLCYNCTYFCILKLCVNMDSHMWRYRQATWTRVKWMPIAKND